MKPTSINMACEALERIGVPDRDVAIYSSVTLKNPYLNMQFRELCVDTGYESREFAEEMWVLCARDPLFFLNTFVYLLETRAKQDWNTNDRYGTNKVIPFITRGYQDTLVTDILIYLGRKDIVIPKSRETGISWIMIAIAAWDWIFHDQTHIGFVSKDLLSANNPSDPDALFSKFHFLIEHLPYWILAPSDYERNIGNNTYKNLRNQSSITAYAAKGDIGRGGRKTWMLKDEFHFFEQGDDYAALDSTAHVTPSRVFVSTANRDRGMSGAFYDVCSDATKNGIVLVVDWKDDPDKRRGLYHADAIEGTDTYRLVIDDHEFWDQYDNGDGTYRNPMTGPDQPENYPFILDDRTRSLYYDHVWNRPGSTPQSVAAELDRNFGGATAQIFNPQLLKRTMEAAKPPVIRGDILKIPEKPGEWEFSPLYVGGSTLMWFLLEEGPEGRKVPPKGEYVFGADVSAGTGGDYSSYSALTGLNKDTGQQVFAWRSNRVDPIQFAELTHWVLKWFYDAYIVPEINGPLGTMFINRLAKDLKYGLIYRQVKRGVAYHEATDKVGYTNPDGGIELLKNLEDLVRKGRVTPHSNVALTECGRYFMKGGKLVHSGALSTDDGAGQGKAHGDEAISLGCAAFGIDDVPIVEKKQEDTGPPVGSFLHRRMQHLERIKKQNSKSYWAT